MRCDSCDRAEAAIIFGPEDLGLRAYWGLCLACALIEAEKDPPLDVVCERLAQGVVAGAFAVGMSEASCDDDTEPDSEPAAAPAVH